MVAARSIASTARPTCRLALAPASLTLRVLPLMSSPLPAVPFVRARPICTLRTSSIMSFNSRSVWRVARPQQQQAALGAGHAQLLDGRPALASCRGVLPVGLVRIDVLMVRVGATPGDTNGCASIGYGWIVG